MQRGVMLFLLLQGTRIQHTSNYLPRSIPSLPRLVHCGYCGAMCSCLRPDCYWVALFAVRISLYTLVQRRLSGKHNVPWYLRCQSGSLVRSCARALVLPGAPRTPVRCARTVPPIRLPPVNRIRLISTHLPLSECCIRRSFELCNMLQK